MRKFVWNVHKNLILKQQPGRQICFEDIVAAIDAGGLLDDVVHPNPDRYPNQRVFVVLVSDYVYAVPYIRNVDNSFFLKTIFPSRKLKRIFLRGDRDHV